MIRNRVPDKVKARSMLTAAVTDMRFVEKLPVTSESTLSIIRGVYEDFRMLGDALLTAGGSEAEGIDHHFEMINALMKLQTKAPRPLLVLHELRKLRHKINYQGYIPTEDEAKYALSIKEALWLPVLEEVKKSVEK